MSADRRTGGFLEASPRTTARLAGAFYFFNIVTALAAFSGKGSHWLHVASGLLATASYVTVTILLYYLFKPVNRSVSLVAALFSLAGCAVGVLSPRFIAIPIHSLVFFGVYCLLIAYLIFKSSFLPHVLGALMFIAGLGWLTFVSRPLAASLSPYHYIAGGVGEGLFTLWLLVMGVDAQRWKEQAGRASAVTA